ncbi:MAG: hypothetical protein ACO1NU_01950 [Arcticibacter sp.]
MQDNFDKKLRERIVQVFDEYEDPSADQGWEQLRLKYPAPSRRSAIVYWLGSAAAVLLLIAGVWLLYPENDKIQLASREKPQQAPAAASDTTIPEDSGNAVARPEEAASREENAPEQLASAPAGSANYRNKPEKNRTRPVAVAYELAPVSDSPVTTAITPDAPSETSTNESVAIAAAEAKEQPAGQAPLTSGETKKRQTNTVLESYDQLQQAKRDMLANRTDEKREKRKDSKVSFSLYAGSYVSYAEGSKSRVNTGVGVSSEVDLTSKLKITTGVAIAQNSLRYDTRIPRQAAASFLSAALSDSPNLMVAGPEAKTSAINYSINGYDASLLGLDVPVNLKYTFFEKKNELYLVAGLSSNFFFDETYTYDYGYNSIHDSSVESFPDEKTTTNTSSFDFARMLNLSVGYGYPIGKQSKLSLEPFLKYPLGGLGSQDIRFSSAGLNLKWNFGSR